MLTALAQRLAIGHRLASGRTEYVPPARPRCEARNDLSKASPVIYFSLNGHRSRPAKGQHDRATSVVHLKAPSPVAKIVTLRGLHMRSRRLRAAQMLQEARSWADALTLLEMNSPTEPLEDVWRRLESKTGVPFGTFWSLRWRWASLKDIWASSHSLLRDAHDAAKAQRERRAAAAKAIERVITGGS